MFYEARAGCPDSMTSNCCNDWPLLHYREKPNKTVCVCGGVWVWCVVCVCVCGVCVCTSLTRAKCPHLYCEILCQPTSEEVTAPH